MLNICVLHRSAVQVGLVKGWKEAETAWLCPKSKPTVWDNAVWDHVFHTSQSNMIHRWDIISRDLLVFWYQCWNVVSWHKIKQKCKKICNGSLLIKCQWTVQSPSFQCCQKTSSHSLAVTGSTSGVILIVWQSLDVVMSLELHKWLIGVTSRGNKLFYLQWVWS